MQAEATIVLLSIAILGQPGIAAACGNCLLQQFDYHVLPHVLGWSLGLTAWFCSLMLFVADRDRPALAFLPSCGTLTIAVFFLSSLVGSFVGLLPMAFLVPMAVAAVANALKPRFCSKVVVLVCLAGYAFVVSTALVGPLPFFLMGLVAASATINGFRPQVSHRLSKQSRVGLQAVSVLTVAGMLVGAGFSVHARITRSDADFVLLWGTGPVLDRLASQPKKNKAALRRILAEAKAQDVVDQAAEALSALPEQSEHHQAAP